MARWRGRRDHLRRPCESRDPQPPALVAAKGLHHIVKRNDLAVWVPAFAGTTLTGCTGNDDRFELRYHTPNEKHGGHSCSSGFRRKRLARAAPRNGRRRSTWRPRIGWPSCTASAKASSTT